MAPWPGLRCAISGLDLERWERTDWINRRHALAIDGRFPVQMQSSHKRFKLPDRIDLKPGCADCSNDTGFDTCLNPYSRYQTYCETSWNRYVIGQIDVLIAKICQLRSIWIAIYSG